MWPYEYIASYFRPRSRSCFAERRFVKVSQKGSHVKPRKSEENIRTVIVPLHEELAPGTLKSILRQSGLTVKELKNLLNC
ncbi:type II toxin-antitoxin system HicA family toxin [Neomoorella thermoacetica]|uniref:type II toxin-antitoxin system HicA family toxin n=1 Tax=Neomoorella thermoacetica TaxID=1525 RepID=UPI0030B879BF